MQLRIVPETGYLRVELQHRETAEEMREAIWTILGECRRQAVSSVLIFTRASRPLFKLQEFGLSGFLDEMSPACKVALVADNADLRASDEYIATMAQQRNIDVRAFVAEPAAVRWLRSAPEPVRRYSFNRIVLAGAPAEPGVYALWQGEELIYYGRAYNGATIRSRLLDHYESRAHATHYSWEITAEPAARERELLREYQEAYGRLPRLNAADAA
ncbi:MAG: hypothetical protein A3G81_26165 [Betaproteobacteria bacterium RIFCSPLOWO2_12_FULL_65_14]|nr:MAG: hypothetical protein A3G81_26165 [Betaproteobacteria bacterium RIFCSPLOWO2_12_FULL_65_14]